VRLRRGIVHFGPERAWLGAALAVGTLLNAGIWPRADFARAAKNQGFDLAKFEMGLAKTAAAAASGGGTDGMPAKKTATTSEKAAKKTANGAPGRS
jgi:hypothetical protein